MSALAHTTILLDEAADALIQDASGVYVDGTYGRGGHSRAILSRLSATGQLLAFDRDPEAIQHAQQVADPRFVITQGNFSEMADTLNQRGLIGHVNGVLLDLGVSSPQLDDASRGFSFMQDGPLDMRMNPEQSPSAEDWINVASVDEMSAVFREYGEERYARRIAAAIVRERAGGRIRRTLELADIVTRANPAWEKHKHPATRVFQAIRIFINSELDELQRILASVVGCLSPGGRVVVIAFHSLEDRIVKQFLRAQSQGNVLPRGVPVMGLPEGRSMRLVGKATKPSEAEVNHNPRARSAVMRVGEKL